MGTEQRMVQIRKALNSLGATGVIDTIQGWNRSLVYIDGEYFGVYDHYKNTFID